MKDRDQAGAELAENAGQRVRVLDEHMYRIDMPVTRPTTMRLQLFTAPGLRPVAVATQKAGEGCSLVNCAESFAAHVWHTHFPDQMLPPLWVHRLIPESDSAKGFTLVRFDVEPDRSLSSPRWLGITQAQLDHLIGVTVDPTRGQDFVPRPPEPQYRPRWVLTALATMPATRPFRATCMTGTAPQIRTPWWRRLLPTRRPSEVTGNAPACCWYHGGDWRQVHDLAARLLPTAEAEATDPGDIGKHVLAAARAEGVTNWTLQALYSLFDDPIGITESGGNSPARFIDGQHRVHAMRDAGLTHTFIAIDELIEDPTNS